MNTKKLAGKILVCAAIAMLSIGSVTMAEAKTKIIMSNDNSAMSLKGRTFETLIQEINKRVGDDVKIEMFHSGALFDQKTQIQGLQLGSAHLICPSSGIYSAVAPKIAVLSLPFLLSTPEKIEAAMADPVVRSAIMPELESKNIIPVAIWINGARDISYKGDKAILLPEDMKGIKIRTQNIPSDLAAMKAAGAHSIAMSWSEVPTAMQQGVIDAVEPTANALAGAGLIDTIDQTTKVGYKYSFWILGANKQWWNGLEGKVKTAIQEALKATTAWNWENAAKANNEGYQKVLDAGKKINEITPEQRAEWVKAMKPVWEEFGDNLVGKDVMKRLIEISQQ